MSHSASLYDHFLTLAFMYSRKWDICRIFHRPLSSFFLMLHRLLS